MVVLRFTLLKGYPSEKAPLFEWVFKISYSHNRISAPDLEKDHRSKLMHVLLNLCNESIGSPVIYSMTEKIQSFLEDLVETTTPSEPKSEDITDDIGHQLDPTIKFTYNVPSVRDHLVACGKRLPIAIGVKCPTIHHGETITDRKSVFQVGCMRVLLSLGHNSLRHSIFVFD